MIITGSLRDFFVDDRAYTFNHPGKLPKQISFLLDIAKFLIISNKKLAISHTTAQKP